MTTIIIAIVGAVFASTGLFAFLQYLITRSDRKKDVYEEISRKLKFVERDECRTQMLVMMNFYPEEHAEIMKLAEKYFIALKGDWYLTSLFEKWLKKNHVARPMWFKEEGEQ